MDPLDGALMTALLVILGALAAVGLFMFFVKREEEKRARKRTKKQKEERRLEEERRKEIAPEHPVKRLKVGDVVSLVGTDFIVQGVLRFREGGFEWVEYKLADATDIRWLEVEDDDELWIALYKEVDDLRITGPRPPERLVYQGETYELEEQGYATMRKEGEVGRRALPECRYYDYEGPGDHVLSIEQWGENFEVSVGTRVSPYSVEVFPASSR
jgi:hypothetical protein